MTATSTAATHSDGRSSSQSRTTWPERARRTQTLGIIHEGFAVLAHCSHRGVPTDPELASDLSDAVGVFTDPSAHLDPSSARQRRPRPDLWVLFAPRSSRAVAIR